MRGSLGEIGHLATGEEEGQGRGMAEGLGGRDVGEITELGGEMGLVVEAAFEGDFGPAGPVGGLVSAENGLEAEEAGEDFGREAEVARAEVGGAGDFINTGGAVRGEEDAGGVGEGGVGVGTVLGVGEKSGS